MFCDNYLEIVKKRIYENKPGKESSQYALYTGLLTLVKLISPIMPFISEEIYLTYFKKIEKEKSIHISSWPGSISSFVKAKENSKNAADADHKNSKDAIMFGRNDGFKKRFLDNAPNHDSDFVIAETGGG